MIQAWIALVFMTEAKRVLIRKGYILMSYIYKLLMCTNLVAMIHTIGNIPSTVPSIRYHKGFTISSECQCQYGFFAVHIKAVLLH